MNLAGSGSTRSENAGFSLIEVLFAMVILMIAALGLAQMFAVAIQRNAGARHQTSTTVLAVQKMEQLRALTWGFDPANPGMPISDITTNLATDPPGGTGTGLNPSPTNALDVNTAGYVDFLDKRGQWVGTGSTPPPTAQYVRRWSIQPLPTNPNNTLVLQVLVTPVYREQQQVGAGQRTRQADDALITTVKTRKSS
jgi:prepilin-type N-terminal cleavage/methylation domain-containing protein